MREDLSSIVRVEADCLRVFHYFQWPRKNRSNGHRRQPFSSLGSKGLPTAGRSSIQAATRLRTRRQTSRLAAYMDRGPRWATHANLESSLNFAGVKIAKWKAFGARKSHTHIIDGILSAQNMDKMTQCQPCQTFSYKKGCGSSLKSTLRWLTEPQPTRSNARHF
jgi:hypothetical protein